MGLTFRIVMLCLVGIAQACGGETFTENGPGGNGGPAPGSPSPGPGDPSGPDPQSPTTPGSSCGGQTIPIALVQKGDIPDLHLVVDRSSSMSLPVDFFQWWVTGSKWDAMKRTLNALVEAYKTNIRFGLTMFPGDDNCGAGKINVPLESDNWQTIQQNLNLAPFGNTPTPMTLAAVRSYLLGTPPGKGPRYVLLATDGMPNCGAQEDSDTSSETLLEVQQLAASGLKTFVVGFGDVVMANPALLNQLAQAGGVPNPKGPQAFYSATSEAELKNAFFGIAGGIIPPPCTYALNGAPPDPDNVTVTFDGQPVPRSKSNAAGWNYGSGGMEITFFGPTCDQLRSGSVKEVKFLFGCRGPVID